ncbi:hypothetical protein BAE44_0026222, partial [Dichanthelium oligosanthes]
LHIVARRDHRGHPLPLASQDAPPVPMRFKVVPRSNRVACVPGRPLPAEQGQPQVLHQAIRVSTRALLRVA